MDRTDIIYNLAEILNCSALKYEPLSKHTTFKIGGAADTYVRVTSLSKLSAIIKECMDSDVDFMIIGNGSNILAPDEGYHGVVIRLDGDFRKISLVDEDTIYCGAGATLAALCKFALNSGLSGLEFAWGIPGTVGGAVFMNAGAYGGEMKDVVYSVNHLTPEGESGSIEKDGLEMGYRTSVYRGKKAVITGVTLKLKKDDPENIRARMDDYMGRRSSKQPLDLSQRRQRFQASRGRIRRRADTAMRAQRQMSRRRPGKRKARGLYHQPRKSHRQRRKKPYKRGPDKGIRRNGLQP